MFSQSWTETIEMIDAWIFVKDIFLLPKIARIFIYLFIRNSASVLKRPYQDFDVC